MTNQTDPQSKSVQQLLRDLISGASDANVTKVNSSEVDDLERVRLQQIREQEVRKITAEADKMIQDNEGRRVLRDAIFTVTVVWMFLVLVIVWHVGSGKLKLSDTVLVTLITTTTANVFGFMVVVVNYLYNKDKST